MTERFKEPYSDPRWWWEGDYVPICFDCIHFYGAIKGQPCCLAYPKGIPRDLLKEGATHKTPYPGDKGITFKPTE